MYSFTGLHRQPVAAQRGTRGQHVALPSALLFSIFPLPISKEIYAMVLQHVFVLRRCRIALSVASYVPGHPEAQRSWGCGRAGSGTQTLREGKERGTRALQPARKIVVG